MHHRTILHAAMALTAALVACALGFAFATTQREARLAAAAASAPATAASAALAPADATALFDKRCSRCHEPQEIDEWRAPVPAAECPSRLLAFLQAHGKSPAAESEILSRHLCGATP